MGSEVAVVSIITVAAFDPRRLKTTLQSTEAILSENIEHIVVFPSLDGVSKQILESAEGANSNIRCVNDSGKGIYEAMNIGLLHAKGLYTWFVNCGDEVVSRSMPELIQQLMGGRPKWLVGQGIFDWREPQALNLSNLNRFTHFSTNGFISHQTVIVERSEIFRLGCFNANFKVAGDTDLIIKLAKESNPDFFNKEIVRVEKPKFAVEFNRLARVESLKIATRNLNMSSVLRILSREIVSCFKRIFRAFF